MQNHAEIAVIMQDYAGHYAVICMEQSAVRTGQHHTENIVEATAVSRTVSAKAGAGQTGGRGSRPGPWGAETCQGLPARFLGNTE